MALALILLKKFTPHIPENARQKSADFKSSIYLQRLVIIFSRRLFNGEGCAVPIINETKLLFMSLPGRSMMAVDVIPVISV
jgi:hypothetical protein